MSESTIWEYFELPSKGMVYAKPIKSRVSLRSMTTIEEMKRCSRTDTPYKVMSDIIEDCMKDKPEIHVYDMCLGDYQFLLHKLRIVTYGPEYKMQVTCDKCGETTESVGDLESLEVHEWDEEIIDQMNVTLPKSGRLVELKFQTPRDMDMVAYKAREMRKRTKVNTEYEILFTLTTLIRKVDGKEMSALELEEFCKKLPLQDVAFLYGKSGELTRKVGLDTSLSVKCAGCGHELITSFRLTPEFFGPRIH